MPQIHILDSETVDKIAAGEVVERPASVVKELVENAVDAGATAITVEAKEGGIEFIRVTDNGCGMEGEQLRTAFLRHATSKIRSAGDLMHISSLGFRGEALSSIAAVSKVEVITKTAESLTGSRLTSEGGAETGFDEIGAPEGTTFLVRNLFFNTPVRRKFLKTATTEGGYIAGLMEHLALSRPDISFKFILGSQTKFHTPGNGDLREVIYRLYGRETAARLLPVSWEREGIRIEGYLGKPVLVRSNRSFEIYFINGRFIRSSVVAKAIEEGYKEYLMQHKFPFCVLHIGMDKSRVDVNVHPTKMDVRFSGAAEFYDLVREAVNDALKSREMIPEAVPGGETEGKREKRENAGTPAADRRKLNTPEPFEQRRADAYRVMEESIYRAEKKTARETEQDLFQNPLWSGTAEAKKEQTAPASPEEENDFFTETEEPVKPAEKPETAERPEAAAKPEAEENSGLTENEDALWQGQRKAPQQLNLFEERILTAQNRAKYRLIGQVFDTYWMIQFEEKLLIVDQHAAHEKVKYERLMKQYRDKAVVSQRLLPPVIVSLTGQEELVLKENLNAFSELGFEVEAFGGKEYALRSVPVDLYGCSGQEMFLEVLDGLSEGTRGPLKSVEEKIASMSCKAAVKGNSRLSAPEASRLIDELLTLDNPYHCPHGRPTVITMSRAEMEKKFKRIV